jgi:hypothetical protein
MLAGFSEEVKSQLVAWRTKVKEVELVEDLGNQR